MKYLLDTNSCIDHLRLGINSTVTHRLSQVPPVDVTLCSVVRGELLTGALKSRMPQQGTARVLKFAAQFPSLPFDDRAADRYASIRADLERIGQPIGPNGLFIAAIAEVNQLIVVTKNLREFQRVPGISCEDWTVAPTP